MSESGFTDFRGDGELAAAAEALFTAEFSARPTGSWVAPGRVNLIGDHVDYAGGLCLPFACGMATAVAAAPRADRTVRAVSLAPDGTRYHGSVDLDRLDGSGELPDWRGYIAGTVWALGGDGMDLAVVSDVPVGSGLSSSAALECAVAVAVRDLAPHGHPAGEAGDDELIAAAMRAENEVVGASTGGLDQRASVSAQRGHALAIDFLSGTHRQVAARWPGLHLVVIDTRATHSHVTGQYASRRGVVDAVAEALGGPQAFRRDNVADEAADWAGRTVDGTGAAQPTLPPAVSPAVSPETVRRRIRHVHDEIVRTSRAVTALEAGDFEAFGELMNASHGSLRDDFEVVTAELESAVQAARGAGALGARMTGGGFGGSVIALTDDPEAVATAVAQAAEKAGLPRPEFYVSAAEDGAHRVR